MKSGRPNPLSEKGAQTTILPGLGGRKNIITRMVLLISSLFITKFVNHQFLEFTF